MSDRRDKEERPARELRPSVAFLTDGEPVHFADELGERTLADVHAERVALLVAERIDRRP